MRIDFVELGNFRRLRAVRVALAPDKTLFVGANNSGKTSAMVALRYFLVPREQSSFTLDDFTLSAWPKLDAAGEAWEKAQNTDQELPTPDLAEMLPFLDVWLHVEDTEVHYVRRILPTLDWEGGKIGVRLRLEPNDPQKLQADYLAAKDEAKGIQSVAETGESFPLWPESLTKFLQRRLRGYFKVKAYILDPAKCSGPEQGFAKPQALMEESEPVEGDPFEGLIRIDEISAQRGFGQPAGTGSPGDETGGPAANVRATRRLSDQLRRYYDRHLDPSERPNTQDITALKAIDEAQRAFDARLQEGFAAALTEMGQLGYPGVTDPKLHISTRLRPIDGLNHEAAVQYVVPIAGGDGPLALRLPEASNGLGYQNLISMVFRLMSFRDAWMRVGKALGRGDASRGIIPPLHLVLIEEPEVHLHTQVQQVFIRQAYNVLRNHTELKDGSQLTTQLVVSTHSSHIAHECEFSSLRYFRRVPADPLDIPTSCVVNLTNVFGEDTETKRFVTRYLKVTHCDLFFADAAVLIEGPAERILVPHFVRSHKEFRELSECYITWLEIAGSHAHRLRELIEHLALTTLIITDLDAIDTEGRAAPPSRGCGQRTRNATLKSWCPAADDLDKLLAKSGADKVKEYKGQKFCIRSAYQCPISINFKATAGEALANTLEDALVFQNIDLFSDLQGTGLIAKFRNTIEKSATISDLAASIAEDLKGGGKAELALDLLDVQDAASLKPPEYIREGLVWLLAQLRRNQEELGLPIAAVAPMEAAP